MVLLPNVWGSLCDGGMIFPGAPFQLGNVAAAPLGKVLRHPIPTWACSWCGSSHGWRAGRWEPSLRYVLEVFPAWIEALGVSLNTTGA